MGNLRCNWVQARLPLLAGGDLLGSERRRVERHLIGCLSCRSRLEAQQRAAEVLQAAAAEPPARGDAPSLWPALARQIRESRRPAPLPGLAWAFAWFRLRPWPTLGLSLGLLAVAGLTVAARSQLAAARAVIVRNARPVAVPLPRPATPVEAPPPTQLAQQAEPDSEAAPPPRFDYVLDHGTPMGPDAPESRSKLTH